MNLINAHIIDVPFTSKPKLTKAGYKRKKNTMVVLKFCCFLSKTKLYFSRNVRIDLIHVLFYLFFYLFSFATHKKKITRMVEKKKIKNYLKIR